MKPTLTNPDYYVKDFDGDTLTQDVIRAVHHQFGKEQMYRTSAAFYRLAYGDGTLYKGGLIQMCIDQVGRDVALFVSGYLGGQDYIPLHQKPPF